MNTPSKPLPLPRVVSQTEWEDARAALLQQEKALTRMKDSVAAMRRRLPVVEVTSDYVLHSTNGPVSLLDLFEGRPQLIVQHFMFEPTWDEGCDGCAMMAERIGPLSHLHARRTSFALVSRAPLDKLVPFRERMGWDLPWFSSEGSNFNDDFDATADGKEQQAISVFLRHGDRIFRSWATTRRGGGTVHDGVRPPRPDPLRATGELGMLTAGLAAGPAVRLDAPARSVRRHLTLLRRPLSFFSVAALA